MRGILTSGLLMIGLCSCASFDYSDRNELRGSGYIVDEISYGDYEQRRNVKTLGSLTLSNYSKIDDEHPGKTFTLKREKSNYFAETVLFTSANKEKTFFDERSFSFGLDKKKKGLNFEYSLKF